MVLFANLPIRDFQQYVLYLVIYASETSDVI